MYLKQGGRQNNLGEERERNGDPCDEQRDKERKNNRKSTIARKLKQPKIASVASK